MVELEEYLRPAMEQYVSTEISIRHIDACIRPVFLYGNETDSKVG